MSDLIRRDDLLDLYKAKEEYRNYSVPLPVIILDIKDMPAVDAVEVVRCKDCKYWGSPTENQEAICRHWSSYYGSIRTMDYQYCSCGERRKENAVD